jgi:uncharacterized protein (TIGR02145 family)
MTRGIITILIVCFLSSCSNRKQSITESGKPAGEAIMPDTVNNLTETIQDVDGNMYSTLRIGKQTWMKENLRTTKFNDGTPIKLVITGPEWSGTAKASYCWYNNEESSYKDLYGALYNGHAASSDKLCPQHWHVPSDAEWNALSRFLGGDKIAGGKLKEAGYDYWVNPNTAADNSSGFSALPGGLRYSDGVFHDFGFSAYFWTSEKASSGKFWFRYMDYEYSELFRFNNSVNIGFSIRCVRDY